MTDQKSSPASVELEHKLAAVVLRWVRAYREAEAARLQAMVDRASYDSFPASDPVAPAASVESDEAPQQIECVINGDCLTLRCLPRGATATSHPSTRDADLSFDGEMPDGAMLHVLVHVQSLPSAEGAVEKSEATLPSEPVHAGEVPKRGQTAPSGGPAEPGEVTATTRAAR